MNELRDIDLPKRLTLVTLAVGLSACGGGGGSGTPTVSAPGGTGGSGSGSGAGSGGISGGGTTAVTVSPVKTVVAGNNLTLALKATGSTYIWGENIWGQMANGTLTTPQSAPMALAATATWISVAAGGNHTLGIKSDGTLWAWGLNLNGQLGNGTSGSYSPGQPKYQNTPLQIGSSKNWTSVSAGDAHSIGLQTTVSGTTTTRVMLSWGQNDKGQLGLGTLNISTNPVTVNVNTTDVTVPTPVLNAVAFVNNSLVLPATLPFTTVVNGSKVIWSAVACNGSYSIALRSDGLIFTWGDNSSSQLGQLVSVLYPSVPTQITLPVTPTATSIAAGGTHVLVIATDHTLVAWGSNSNGQLGNGVSGSGLKSAPFQIGTDQWVAVAAGGAHSLAIRYADRTLWSWGANADGQLGNGTTTDSSTPAQVGSGSWIAVAAGKSHSLAIDSNFRLWAWGRNAEGQLGNGSTTALLVPTQIP